MEIFLWLNYYMSIEDPNQFDKEQNKETNEGDVDFEKLIKKNPENPLFKNNFENVPNNFVSVFHYADIANIDSLGHKGLQASFKEQFATDAIKKVDPIFDKYAPWGFSRSRAVLCLSPERTWGYGPWRA